MQIYTAIIVRGCNLVSVSCSEAIIDTSNKFESQSDSEYDEANKRAKTKEPKTKEQLNREQNQLNGEQKQNRQSANIIRRS
jgi:hypothetical protein